VVPSNARGQSGPAVARATLQTLESYASYEHFMIAEANRADNLCAYLTGWRASYAEG